MIDWTHAWPLTIVMLVCIALAVNVLILHKVRRIHISMFKLMEDVEVTRAESSALFSQLQALSALQKKLALTEPLPPLRGWAGSPDFLLTIADTALDCRPRTVIECSSGSSTVVIARCLQISGSGHLFSLEHDPEYAERTTAMLGRHGLSEWATVLHAPLIDHGAGTVWYDDSVLPEGIGPVDLLVVDGPPADTAPLARLPALPRLRRLFAETAIVILDDAAREEETEIVRRWLAEAPEFKARYLPHEKGCAILERSA
jgi:predicted O-methyltransferase YrrM